MYRAVMLLFLVLTFLPTVAAAQQPCTTEAQEVVTQVYRHILERSTEEGSAHWTQRLESGQADVRSVVRDVVKSSEYVTRFYYTEAGEGTPYERSVARLYRHLLGRQPDAGGQRTYAELAQRRGAAAVIDAIIASQEYDREFGSWGVPGSGGVHYCPPANWTARGDGAPVPPVVPINQRRFRAMDRNNDGVITAAEWRGNGQSFNVHDWNNDGVLTGDELDEAAARSGRTVEDEAFDRADRFDDLDVSHNGRIEAAEWHGTAVAFNRLDRNNDNVLSRDEMIDRGFGGRSAAASGVSTGQLIRVGGTERWTNTGIDVRAGDLLNIDAQGTVQLSDSANDTAGVGGTRSGRRATRAPLGDQAAGALIAQIGTSQEAFVIGNQRSVRAPASGRLYLGVNDDYLPDNRGGFEVIVNAQSQAW